jgi:hypothetical protein
VSVSGTYLSFLFICDQLPLFVTKTHIDVVLSPPLFHPDVTVSDNCEYFVQLNSLRSYAISAAVRGNYGPVALLRWVQYPDLFVEIVHQLIGHCQYFVLDESGSSAYSKVLMTTSLYYQKLHHEEDLDVEKPRAALLLFISRLLDKPGHLALFFANNLFNSLLLSFLFEDPLTEFVFGQLGQFLHNVPKLAPSLSHQLEQILQICLPSFPEERFVVLVIRLLTSFNDGLICNRSLRPSFEPFYKLFFESFTKFTVCNETVQNYMLQVLQFFALAGNSQSLSSPDVEALVPPIEMAFDDELPQHLKLKSIQLVAGEVLPSFNPRFILRHPRPLNIYLKVSLRDPNVIECLEFINAVVQCARVNALRCR